jgi:hypothetical protein
MPELPLRPAIRLASLPPAERQRIAALLDKAERSTSALVRVRALKALGRYQGLFRL